MKQNFFGQNLFGTDGIRGLVGHFPFDLESLITLGQAIGLWAQKKYGEKQTSVLIGNDTRISCDFVKSALKTGLLSSSVNIYDGGVLPTPAVFNIIHDRECPYQAGQLGFGIVISASHNPYQYNGIKLFDAKTGKLKQEDEAAIVHLFYEQKNKPTSPTYESLGTETEFHGEADSHYVDDIITRFNNLLQNKKIVLDCAHGATYDIAPIIFQTTGAQIIVMHNEPDGKNINHNCGSTNPENLREKVLQEKADIGFAFDGDGDRLTVVNRHGEIKDGDDILALLTHHPKYQNEKAVVGTIVTNFGLEKFLENQNKKLMRAQVGEKYVATALEKHNLLLGGEPSGHIVMRDYLNSGDSIFAALRIAETAQFTDNWDLKTFEKFPQAKINVPITEKKDLDTGPLADIIAASKTELDAGRVIVRYSGTEPILRVTVEAATQKQAQSVCMKLVKRLKEA